MLHGLVIGPRLQCMQYALYVSAGYEKQKGKSYKTFWRPTECNKVNWKGCIFYSWYHPSQKAKIYENYKVYCVILILKYGGAVILYGSVWKQKVLDCTADIH